MNTKSKLHKSLLLMTTLLLFTTTSCVNLAKPYPDKKYYSLDLKHSAEDSPAPKDMIVIVNSFRISANFATNKLVYRESEYEFKTDFYNEFLTTPSTMITDQTVRWLTQSRLFKMIAHAGVYIEPTHYLQGNIISLYGDYRDEENYRAIIEIQFFLIKKSPAKGSVTFQKTYKQSAPLASRNPEELVKGHTKALTYILKKLENDLRQL